jgi:hypothetical protein
VSSLPPLGQDDRETDTSFPGFLTYSLRSKPSCEKKKKSRVLKYSSKGNFYVFEEVKAKKNSSMSRLKIFQYKNKFHATKSTHIEYFYVHRIVCSRKTWPLAQTPSQGFFSLVTLVSLLLQMALTNI